MTPLPAVVDSRSRRPRLRGGAPPLPAATPPLRAALIGCGTVGRALLRALASGAGRVPVRLVSVTDRSGTVLDPTGLDPRAVLAAKEGPGLAALPAEHLPWDGAAAAALSPAEVVVDLAPSRLGGTHPSAEPLLAALEAGRSVVTASKAALALYPWRVREGLGRTGAALRCSAAVAGGVPVLELLEGALLGSGVEEVAGAWNATSTFVLARVEEGATPAEALAEARRRGFAEEDASADLDGRDAAAKACVVAGAAFGLVLSLDRVERTELDGAVFRRAREAARRGRRTRLVARVTARGARVAPETIPEDHPLAAPEGEAAVSVRTRLAGTLALRGPGAGGDATASAVLSDLLALAAAGAAAGPGSSR